MQRNDGFITLTEPNEVFVFGSNKRGIHGAGAARFALDNYGAICGQGNGLQGRSYAIDTMSGYEVLIGNVARFLDDARSMPEFTFVVTPIGCGIAGYSADEVKPLFDDCPSNVILPVEFLTSSLAGKGGGYSPTNHRPPPPRGKKDRE